MKRFMFNKVWSGLDILLIDRSSFLIQFTSEADQHIFSKRIVRLRKSTAYNLVYEGTLNPKSMLKLSNFTQGWKKGEISNFNYIIQLNSLSSRSIHDVKYHPVMPQVLITENPDPGSENIPERDTMDQNSNSSKIRNLMDTLDISLKKKGCGDGLINYLMRKYPYNETNIGNMPFLDAKELHNKFSQPAVFFEFFLDPSFMVQN